MASLRRLGGDAVGLGAVGIVAGTVLAALGAPLLLLLLLGCAVLLTTLRYRWVLLVCMLAVFVIAPYRGVGTRVVIFDPLREIRTTILRPLILAVPGDAGALAAGLTLGDAQYFTNSFRQAMSASATTHLVALSGFNVVLMLGFARSLLRGKVSRKKEAVLACSFLVLFVACAGFQPSLVRAAIMGVVVLVAGVLGRRIAPARLLVLAAALMLLVEPRFVTSLGFILSFISSWALLAMVGDMEKLMISGIGIVNGLRAAVLPTLAAQLGVAPALLAATGSVMLIGLLVNPLVIPITPLLSAVAGLELLVANLAPGLAALTSTAVTVAAAPALFAITLAAKIPLAVNVSLPVTLVAVIYATWVATAIARKPELW